MSKKKKQLQHHQIKTLLEKKSIILLYQHSNIKAQGWTFIKQEFSKTPLKEVATRSTSLLEASSGARAELSTNIESINCSQAGSFPLTPRQTKGDEGVLTLVIKNRIGQLSSLTSGNTGPTPSLSIPFADNSNIDSPRPLRNGEQGGLKPQHNSALLRDATTRKPNIRSQGQTPLLQGSIFLLACDSHQEMVLAYDTISRCRDSQKTGMAVVVGGFYYGRVMTHLDVVKLSTLTPLAFGSLPLALERKLASLVNEDLLHCQRELLRCLNVYKSLLATSDDAGTR